jgi:hypothetical protein
MAFQCRVLGSADHVTTKCFSDTTAQNNIRAKSSASRLRLVVKSAVTTVYLTRHVCFTVMKRGLYQGST